ncbi:exosome complex component RRP45A-like isoform X2 [Tripterygium wilfordii]|uniref:exosome complex component RRP45A-like isoform X2 n=1 Tax=Tripterygium wilfordii TaxID=458696 RepID=UPI0018F861ED|nr:exosome complex component RRP45A-like isoform X2 [Tripterygium wilfordii]
MGDVKLANMWRLTLNEKKFIETALLSDLRIDGRGPFECRKLSIDFGREDGSSEVQLGQTRVMGFVSSQLVQPYRDRPNEGTLSIFTEFSPMADPSFEPGHPGESAVELGRVIDRGLRESRAVDTESLCVLAGKMVWAVRVDLLIVDNGGNLVDAANIAALAALLTFRLPACMLGGEDGREVIVHSPEVKEPIPLMIHHLPIAVTFAFLSSESMVIDPTHQEEAVMGGRMTATLNAIGDICAIQKAGGEGVMQSVVMQCLRIASKNATLITKKINEAVEKYNTERALRKIKRHPASIGLDATGAGAHFGSSQNQSAGDKGDIEISRHHLARLNPLSKQNNTSQHVEGETKSSEQSGTSRKDVCAMNFFGGPSSWDPYSKGADPEFLKASLASRGMPYRKLPKLFSCCFHEKDPLKYYSLIQLAGWLAG